MNSGKSAISTLSSDDCRFLTLSAITLDGLVRSLSAITLDGLVNLVFFDYHYFTGVVLTEDRSESIAEKIVIFDCLWFYYYF